MILKVRTSQGNWKYYEGFYAVEVTKHVDEKQLAELECFEIHRREGVVGPEVKTSASLMVVADMSHPSEMKIAFNTDGYLLNYEGKTIERL
jgi:hypothetical protein